MRRLPLLLGLMTLLLAFVSIGAGPTTVSAQEQDQRLEVALFQTYFLSVDNFAGPVMMGGMGIPFMPPMEAMQQMAQMAQFDLAMMPQNPGLVQAIFTSGAPRLVPGATVDPMDFGTMRWDPAGFDTTIRTADQAMLMIKFIEWAKYFHKAWQDEAVLFPPPMERFLSLAFIVEPKVIAQFAAANLMSDQGFIHAIKLEGDQPTVVDGSVKPFDQALMLWALADLVYTMKDTEAYPNLRLPGDEERLASLSAMMDQVFMLAQANPVTNVRDKGIAIVALLWYSVATDNNAQRVQAVNLINEYARSLGQDERTAFEKAASIRGLLEAWRITGSQQYQDTALRLWQELDALWDAKAKAYAPLKGAIPYVYTPWDAGLIVGALAEVRLAAEMGLPTDVRDLAQQRYLDFFEGFIQGSGFSHRPVPTPGGAGVFVSQIGYNRISNNWTVTNDRYTTLGSQYAANELIWLEGTFRGRLTGYPDVTEARQAIEQLPSVGDATVPWIPVAAGGAGAALLVATAFLWATRRRAA